MSKRKDEKVNVIRASQTVPAAGGCLMCVLTLGLWPLLMRGLR